MNDFWRKQEPDKPLFPDILWSKPERRDAAGRLTIVGGNARGFSAVAAAYQTALGAGVGELRVVLPDVLKTRIPPTITEAVFAPSNPSGGLSGQALPVLRASAEWADLALFIGDSGANAETAALLETFLSQDLDQNLPVVIARDAVDLIRNAAEAVLNRANTHLVVSLSQLQKLFQAVYYPRVLTFSQGLQQVSETLHKFTITYPVTITLWHGDHLFAAQGGQVITQKFTTPLKVWSGEIATRAAVWQIWNPTKELAAAVTAWVD